MKFCFMFFLMLGAAGCSSDSAAPDGSPEAESDIPSGGERVSVTEAEIVEAMQADDLARFLGKELELKGTIGAVGADGGGHLLLEMVRLNTFDDEPWETVLPGQEATLVGIYTEERGLKFKIENVTGTRHTFEAVELGKEFVADKAAMNTKLSGQMIEVHGTVINRQVGDADIIRMDLQADGDNYVFCSFMPESQQALVQKVKVGDQIKLVGQYAAQTSFDTPILNFCLLMTE